MAAIRAPHREQLVRCPGFGLSLGVTIFWLSLIVLIPLARCSSKSASGGWDAFRDAAFSERAIAAYRLSFGAAAIAAAINCVFGLLVAWVLVRYRFPGRRLVSALIDLPFALPTAVAGIALTALYADTGPIGRIIEPLGISDRLPAGGGGARADLHRPAVRRAHGRAGAGPCLERGRGGRADARRKPAADLRAGSSSRRSCPRWRPASRSAFARGAGEYGSVIFIAGNMPFKSEIAPLLIVTQLEEYNYAGAAAIAMRHAGLLLRRS